MQFNTLFRTLALVSLTFPLCALDAQWQQSDTTGLANSWSGVAYGDGVFIAVNGWGRIARSTDGGKTFTEVLNTGWANADVEYGSNGTGMAFWVTGKASADYLYESTDGGQTWTDISGDYPFPFSDGGAEIVLNASGELVYTKLRGNNNFSDGILYGNTYYVYGGGPESSVLTSANGQDFSTAVDNSGQWVTGAYELEGKAVPFGAIFETPGDFNTRRGVLYEATTDPTTPSNPMVIDGSDNTIITDVDFDISVGTTLYATTNNTMLTSTDSGASWTAETTADGVSFFDLSEHAQGSSTRVVVGSSSIYYLETGNGGGNGDGSWAGFDVVDGIADTGDILGPVYIAEAPWIYVYDLGKWVYIPVPEDTEGFWTFLP